MKKEDLIVTASKLEVVSDSACKEYIEKLDVMVASVNTLMLEEENILLLIGENNERMMRDNQNNHAKFMASILGNFNPDVLVETILWVFRAYRNRGFHPKYWDVHLNAWLKTISQNLSQETSQQIIPFYIWMLDNIPSFVSITNQKTEYN
jgi:hypothetical protein